MLDRSLKEFNKRLVSRDKSKLLSKVCKLLLGNVKVKDKPRDKRQIDLKVDLSKKDWSYISACITEKTVNVVLREHHYTLQHHWYLTRTRSAKMHWKIMDKCWRYHNIYSCVVAVCKDVTF